MMPDDPDEADKEVERAIFEAAISGNVKAMELWEERRKEREQKRDARADPLARLLDGLA